MAMSDYAEDLIELSLEKIHRAESLLQKVLIKALIGRASTDDLSDHNITQMLVMETTLGELNYSLPRPCKRTRRKRSTPAGSKPISPLTIQQAPFVRRSQSPTHAMQLSTQPTCAPQPKGPPTQMVNLPTLASLQEWWQRQMMQAIIYVLHNKQAANRDGAAATAATVVSVAVAVVVTIAAMHHRHSPHNSVNHRWT